MFFPQIYISETSPTCKKKKKKTSTTTMEISSLSTSRTMKTCLVNEGKGNQNINKYTFVQFLKCSSTTLCLSGSNPMGNLTIVWLMAMANFTLRIPFSLVSPLLQVQCFMVSLGYLRTLMKAPNFPCSSWVSISHFLLLYTLPPDFKISTVFPVQPFYIM